MQDYAEAKRLRVKKKRDINGKKSKKVLQVGYYH